MSLLGKGVEDAAKQVNALAAETRRLVATLQSVSERLDAILRDIQDGRTIQIQLKKEGP